MDWTVVTWIFKFLHDAVLGPDVVKKMNVKQMTRNTTVQDKMLNDPLRAGTDQIKMGYIQSLGIQVDLAADVLSQPDHVLFLQGTRDKFCPPHMFELGVNACTIPHTQVEWLQGHCHNIVHELGTPAIDMLIHFCKKCLAKDLPHPQKK